MVVFNDHMLSIVSLYLFSIDLHPRVFSLAQSTNIEVIVQNPLYRHNRPSRLRYALTRFAFGLFPHLLGHSGGWDPLLCKVIGDSLVAPPFVVVEIEDKAYNVCLRRDDLEFLVLVDTIPIRCCTDPLTIRLPPLDNIANLFGGIRHGHLVDQELKLDLQPIVIIGEVNAVADGNDADTCVAQILQLHQTTTVAARESGEVLDDENVIPVIHQSVPHGLIALPLLKCIAGAIAVFVECQCTVRKAMFDKVGDDRFLVFDGHIIPVQFFVY